MRPLLVILFLLSYSIPARTETFDVSVKSSGIQRITPPLRVIVSVGKIKFTFLTPDGFRVREDQLQQRVVMEHASQNCSIVFRRSLPMEEGMTHRELLLARYPGATIVAESSRPVAGQPAKMFTLQWIHDGAPYTVCVAFVSTLAGPMEIDAFGTSDVKTFFKSVFSTLRSSDEDGKLEILLMSDQA